MAHYLCEFYTPRPAWRALDPDTRQQFFDRISTGMAVLAEAEKKPVALGSNDLGMTLSRGLALPGCGRAGCAGYGHRGDRLG